MSEWATVTEVSAMLEQANHQLLKGPDSLWPIWRLMVCSLLTLAEGYMLSLASSHLQATAILSEMNSNQQSATPLPSSTLWREGGHVFSRDGSSISSFVKPSLLPG